MQEQNDFGQMPSTLLQVLTQEMKETKDIVLKTYSSMAQRRESGKQFYKPTDELLQAIQTTRSQFQAKVDASLNLINDEIDQLKEIERINEYSLEELRKSSLYLQTTPSESNDVPINLAIRSIASLFPLITFAILSLCTK